MAAATQGFNNGHGAHAPDFEKHDAVARPHRKAAWALGMLLLLGAPALSIVALAPPAGAQVLAKVIEGKVLDGASTPLPGGIVYLQDQKTNVVKTFIATADGSYRFGQLPADTDYKVWAEYKGQKSKDKLVSSFDTKMNVTYNFHIGK